MSATASVFDYKTSATPSIKGRDGSAFILNFRLINKIMDALCDVDLYESQGEPKPSGSAIVTAADVLTYVQPQDIDNVEIEPYSGELSLIWRSGRNKRVKVMFGQKRNSYSVYHEQMADGRVIERHLELNANHTYLTERLAWLHD